MIGCDLCESPHTGVVDLSGRGFQVQPAPGRRENSQPVEQGMTFGRHKAWMACMTRAGVSHDPEATPRETTELAVDPEGAHSGDFGMTRKTGYALVVDPVSLVPFSPGVANKFVLDVYEDIKLDTRPEESLVKTYARVCDTHGKLVEKQRKTGVLVGRFTWAACALDEEGGLDVYFQGDTAIYVQGVGFVPQGKSYDPSEFGVFLNNGGFAPYQAGDPSRAPESGVARQRKLKRGDIQGRMVVMATDVLYKIAKVRSGQAPPVGPVNSIERCLQQDNPAKALAKAGNGLDDSAMVVIDMRTNPLSAVTGKK